MDVESKNNGTDVDQRRRRNIIICVAGAVMVTIALIVCIVSILHAVFKPKMPVATFDNMSTQDVDISFDISQLSFVANVTVLINLSIYNPNRVGLKYSDTVAYLRYKDYDVGEAPIVGGEMASKETKAFNLTTRLVADNRFLLDSDVYAQALAGSLPLSTYLEIDGKVEFMLERNIKTYSTCNFNVDATHQSVSNMLCYQETNM